jgi:hypothetical protein
MRLVLRLASIAAAGALAAVALAGPATAATGTLSFAFAGCVTSDGTYYDYAMQVVGDTGFGYSAEGMRVEVRLWGPDWSDDDFLGGPYIGYSNWLGATGSSSA